MANTTTRALTHTSHTRAHSNFPPSVTSSPPTRHPPSTRKHNTQIPAAITMEKIAHFSHKHPLKFFSSAYFQDDDYPEIYKLCGACDRPINSSAYGCIKCNYYIDKACSELPRHLKHPFHPQHTLALPNDWDCKSLFFSCNVCGQNRLGYSCSECEFNLDLVCASLSPTSQIRCEMHLICDPPHPLFICHKPAGYKPRCSCCKLAFSETHSKVYVCVECSHVLHQSCASVKEIRHPFHIEHPLTLLPSPQYEDDIIIKCNACSWEHQKEGPYMFKCEQCDFALDFPFASLMPTSKHIGFHQEVQKQRFNHKHPLIECNYMEEFERLCGGCGKIFEDSIFVCLDCGILLDRQCADLPLEVKHPCHPQHPFQLYQTESLLAYECWLCHANCYSIFAYSCGCNFYLEPSCAVTKPSIINCIFHEHPLAYFSEKCMMHRFLRCNQCNEDCTEEFLHCGECRYTSHLHCCPNLPSIIKHSCHCDPLILNYSKIRDDSDDESDDEFYCNACEELRDLHDPTYYCEECHFVAHLRCVFSELLLCMERSENFDIEDEVKEESCSSKRDKLEVSKDFQKGKQTKEKTDSSSGDESEISKFSVRETLATLDKALIMIQSKVDKMMVKVKRMIAKLERLKKRHELLNKSTTG